MKTGMTIKRLLWSIQLCMMLAMAVPMNAQKHLSRYYVSRAEGHIKSNAWNEAKREIDEGLNAYPDDPDLRYMNGHYYYVMGHLAEARYNLVKAVQVNDQHFKAKRILVDVEDDSKHYSSAICYINELLEFQPYDRDLWRRKIGLYRKMNNDTAADAALERLSRIYPNDSTVISELNARRRIKADKVLQQNSLEEARVNLEHWIDTDPDNLDYYIELISVYQRMGEYERAIGTANRGLIHFPDNEQLKEKAVGIMSEAGLYVQAFRVARKYSPHGKAYRNLLEEMAVDARLRDPYDVHSRLYEETHDRDALNYLVNTSLTRGYYDDARYYLKEAMKRDGRTLPLLSKQYAMEKRLGNEREQLKLLKELYSMSPTDEELTCDYGEMMLTLANRSIMQEQWADAAKQIETALKVIAPNHDSWAAAVSKQMTCLGHLNRHDEAMRLYRQASAQSPLDGKRFASAYEELMGNRLKFLIDEDKYHEALHEAQTLLRDLPKSEVALRCCINMSQTLKQDDLFHDYARRGYEAYPDQPYFIVKQAVALQQQGRLPEALALLQPRKTDDTYYNPMLTSAFSGISQEWAMTLLKNRMPDLALQVADSALARHADDKELLYIKGLAYEQMKQYDKAYDYQRRAYEPSNAEQQTYYQHMRYLKFRGLKNRMDASYTTAMYDTRQDQMASRGHLYSVADISYSRVETRDTYTAQVSYKGIDGYDDGDSHEAGGVGLQFMAQWDHTFNHRWSGMVSASYSTRYFNKVGLNAQLSYAMNHGWTPSLRLGYRRTPETYLFLTSELATHDKYNLYIVTPGIEKSWERIKANMTVDLTAMNAGLYYNVGLKGKLFINDDNISSVSLLTGFGSFPELSFFEQTALRNLSHTNAMVGFDAQYLLTENMYVGLAGNWNTCYNPVRTADGELKDAYKNIYSLTLQLHVAF